MDRVGESLDRLRCLARAFCTAALLAGMLESAHATSPRAALSVWGFDDGRLGATCQDYDLATGFAWRNKAGDWRDADGKPEGDRAFAEISVNPKTRGTVDFDISALAGRGAEFAVLIRALGRERGVTTFHSREAPDTTTRPVLLLTDANGKTLSLPSVADTYLNCSSQKSLGERNTLQVGPASNILMRFAAAAGANASFRPIKAVVRLTLVRGPSRKATYGAFALDPPVASDAATQAGIAARYRDLSALAHDPAVVFVEGFESNSWKSHWSQVGTTQTFGIIADDLGLKFEPLDGKALQVEIPQGKKLGLNLTYDFKDKHGSEPDEIYFRYYLRLGDDWHPTISGGKLPGIAGTYNRAGWGGRKSDGLNGWSMRGGFAKEIPGHRPLAGDTPIGTYAYHADQRGKYGEFWYWSQGRPTALERNRWYCIEQYFRVNTPGKNDGVMMAWIDGVKLFSRSDIRVRDIDSLHIEQVWMNVYHGGTEVSPRDQHLFIDDVVIARRYIGPRANELSRERKAAVQR